MDLSFLKDFGLLALVFLPLERLRPYHREQKMFRPGWANDLVYVVLNGMLIRLGLSTVIAGLVALSLLVVPDGLRAAVAEQPLWQQFIAVFILGDLGFYWAHRLFHSVPALWRFHVVHHSIEDLDWLAAHRVHAVDQIMTKGASLLPIILLGFSPAVIMGWGMFYAWHSILLHANVRVPFGPLANLLASPHFHRWHHSSALEARDRNFAGQLAVLDRLFGTMYAPTGRDPTGYGIDERLPSNWVAQFIYPLARRPIVDAEAVVSSCGAAMERRCGERS